VSARRIKREASEAAPERGEAPGSVEFLTDSEENLRFAMEHGDWIYLAEAFRPAGVACEVLRKDTKIARELLAYIADIFDGKETGRFDRKEKKRSPVAKRGERRFIGSFVAGLMYRGLSQKEAIKAIQDHVMRVDRSTILRAYKVYRREEQERLHRIAMLQSMLQSHQVRKSCD
jgi:hypothetical protein